MRMTRRFSLWLVVLVCAGLAFWLEGPGRDGRAAFFEAWGLSPDALASGRWWTWLTYAFLHGSWTHLAMNLFSLWVVGRQVIDEWGQTVFLCLLGAASVAGGMVQLAISPHGVLVGLSGGIFGLVVAATLDWGDRRVALGIGRFHFARLRGRSLGWGMLAASILMVVWALLWPKSAGAVGHACHAGGALTGAIAVGLARMPSPGASQARR